MTSYIDPTTQLPLNLGEIYSDRNLRILGQVRINPSNANQIDTLGLQIIGTPISGGAEVVNSITNGSYLLGVGASLWINLNRVSSATATAVIYAAGSQPLPQKNMLQVFYMPSSGTVIAFGSYLIQDTNYYSFGYAPKTWDAVVGNSGDASITHTDLQTAITYVASVAPSSGGWILVKKMCSVTTTISIPSGKPIKLFFQGYGTGLQASGSPSTGITFNNSGCQLIGLGQITGFTTGVNLNNQLNSRIEMAFSSNTTNINYGSLVGTQYNIQGSIGVDTRNWDAIVGINTDPSITHTDLQTAITYVAANAPSTGGWILVKKLCLVTSALSIPSGIPIKLQFQGYGTGLQASGAATGITFNNAGCQLVGLGQITGFTTGVNLNNQLNCRIEMYFSGNSTNINYGTLTGLQYEVEGSIGLAENSHIQTSTTDGILARWNNTSKRWEPINAIGGNTTMTVSSAGLITITTVGATITINGTTGALVSTGSIQGATVLGAVYQ